ncbi:sugar phosphate isomerase/epimerase [Paenibacillus athensensis]|uniref:Xylose isomerase-like TIM barrel domain-containing protein n=1 Tax=Paenibacillus athensensis TaxID=1967502 RepID=A0A4Y8QAG9_9BACL|nr:TIM barrel protein [Paenibacillus athensensis]MCD1257592.1 sugar phosphate isomerase/epimerase [Paenibacillus athensensis]
MLANRLSISSWSLHRCLGPLRWTYWNTETKRQDTHIQDQPQELELLALPQEAARRGLRYLELCHFHFPSTTDEYLRELKQAFLAADIVFHTLLVDYGDISSPDEERRASDIRYLTEWVEIAAKSGARAIRIVAGEQPAGDVEATQRCGEALRQLQQAAAQLGVEIVTENFRELTSTLESWTRVMDTMEPGFRTIVDFGNLHFEEKLSGIAYGAPLAHSIHAKPAYDENGELDTEDFARLLAVLRETNCDVPISVIFDREGDMWAGIEKIKQEILKN